MKRCSKCKRKLPLSEFSPDKRASDGLTSQCHGCRGKYRRAHKREITKYNKKYYQTHKIEAVVYNRGYRQTIKGYLYGTFNEMKRRCQDLKSDNYERYGGRGTEVRCTFSEFYHHITVTLDYDTVDKLKGLEIDRIDTNGHYELGNIRVVTPSQNQMNSRKRRIWHGRLCSSRFKGVSWSKQGKKWITGIRVDGKCRHLGYFTDETAAAEAYDEASLKYHGEFGATNESLGLFDRDC